MLDFLWRRCLKEQVVDVRRTTDLDLDNDNNDIDEETDCSEGAYAMKALFACLYLELYKHVPSLNIGTSELLNSLREMLSRACGYATYSGTEQCC